MFTHGDLVQAACVAAGAAWCREMFTRWRSDLDEFRSSTDFSMRAGVVIPWLATGVVVVLLVRFLIGIAARFEYS